MNMGFAAFNEKDAEEIGIGNGDSVLVKTHEIRNNEVECLSFLTNRLSRGTIVIFHDPYQLEKRYRHSFAEYRKIEEICIYKNIGFLHEMVHKKEQTCIKKKKNEEESSNL